MSWPQVHKFLIVTNEQLIVIRMISDLHCKSSVSRRAEWACFKFDVFATSSLPFKNELSRTAELKLKLQSGSKPPNFSDSKSKSEIRLWKMESESEPGNRLYYARVCRSGTKGIVVSFVRLRKKNYTHSCSVPFLLGRSSLFLGKRNDSPRSFSEKQHRGRGREKRFSLVPPNFDLRSLFCSIQKKNTVPLIPFHLSKKKKKETETPCPLWSTFEFSSNSGWNFWNWIRLKFL